MTDSPYPLRRRRAANDNASPKTREARRAWIDNQTIIKKKTFDTLKLVANMAGEDGQFFVSGQAFAAALKVSRRSVFNHLKKLIEAGLVTHSGKKCWVYSYYRLTLPLDTLSSESAGRQAARGGANPAPDARNFCADKPRKNQNKTTPTSREAGEWSKENGKKKKNEDVPFVPYEVLPAQREEGIEVPAYLRKAFVRQFGASIARSYLFPCQWENDNRALLANTSYALRWLKD